MDDALVSVYLTKDSAWNLTPVISSSSSSSSGSMIVACHEQIRQSVRSTRTVARVARRGGHTASCVTVRAAFALSRQLRGTTQSPHTLQCQCDAAAVRRAIPLFCSTVRALLSTASSMSAMAAERHRCRTLSSGSTPHARADTRNRVPSPTAHVMGHSSCRKPWASRHQAGGVEACPRIWRGAFATPIPTPCRRAGGRTGGRTHESRCRSLPS